MTRTALWKDAPRSSEASRGTSGRQEGRPLCSAWSSVAERSRLRGPSTQGATIGHTSSPACFRSRSYTRRSTPDVGVTQSGGYEHKRSHKAAFRRGDVHTNNIEGLASEERHPRLAPPGREVPPGYETSTLEVQPPRRQRAMSVAGLRAAQRSRSRVQRPIDTSDREWIV